MLTFRTIAHALLGGMLAEISADASAQGPPAASFAMERLGLSTSPYSSVSGVHSTLVENFSMSRVVGRTLLFPASGDTAGWDVWTWDGFTTRVIGLRDARYLQSPGNFTDNRIVGVAANEWTFGIALRRGNVGRWDPWVADSAGNTAPIGLFGEEYWSPALEIESTCRDTNRAGQAVGYSKNFVASRLDAWLWENGACDRLGFGDLDWQADIITENGLIAGRRGDGLAFLRRQGSFETLGLSGSTEVPGLMYGANAVRAVNSNGLVAGLVNRGVGQAYEYVPGGTDTWVYRDGQTMLVGLRGPLYVSETFHRSGTAWAMNDSGVVVGWSNRVQSGSSGNDAWAWKDGRTYLIGLLGPLGENGAGTRYVYVTHLLASGLVVGYSQRVGVNGEADQQTWVWSNGVTERIGYWQTGYTQSLILDAHENGRVLGASEYVGTDGVLGRAGWSWYNGETRSLGLTGLPYSTAGGTRLCTPMLQNADGVIVGTSPRARGSFFNGGIDSWYYEPVSGTTIAVIGSVRTSDQASSSTPTLLTDDGVMYGTFRYYPGGSGPGERRLFAYRPDLGFVDLNERILGGAAAQGWTGLVSITRVDPQGNIFGTGVVVGQRESVYERSAFVLRPPVPGGGYPWGGTPCNAADVVGVGSTESQLSPPDGQLTVDDVLAFVNLYLSGANCPGLSRCNRADIAGESGAPEPDGVLDAGDLVAFINAMSEGCP